VRFLLAATLAIAVIAGQPPLAAQTQAAYLYTLANFGGPLPYDGVRISVDHDAEETYLIYQNLVYIFSASGMEVYRFGADLDLGQILDVAADSNGDLILLSVKDSRSRVTRCTFRGVPIGPMEITGLPPGLSLVPNRLIRRGDKFYFASLAASRVVITDSKGTVESLVDFLPLLEADERRDGVEAMGFTVDHEGNIFLTMPTLFRVFKRTPDGKLTSFGRSGSAPGRFGIVAGIGADSRGNLIVADKLKSVVMVFDRDFNFLTEFGYRGAGPDNLVVPDDIAVDKRDRVYVSQWRRRGVSVFALNLR
jgi:hypothetical protein